MPLREVTLVRAPWVGLGRRDVNLFRVPAFVARVILQDQRWWGSLRTSLEFLRPENQERIADLSYCALFLECGGVEVSNGLIPLELPEFERPYPGF